MIFFLSSQHTRFHHTTTIQIHVTKTLPTIFFLSQVHVHIRIKKIEYNVSIFHIFRSTKCYSKHVLCIELNAKQTIVVNLTIALKSSNHQTMSTEFIQLSIVLKRQNMNSQHNLSFSIWPCVECIQFVGYFFDKTNFFIIGKVDKK